MQTQPLQLRQRKNECEASQPDIIKPMGGGQGVLNESPEEVLLNRAERQELTLTVRERMRREAVKQ